MSAVKQFWDDCPNFDDIPAGACYDDTKKAKRGRPRKNDGEGAATEKKPPLTIELLESELYKKGITVRFDSIAKKQSVEGSDIPSFCIDNNLPIVLSSELKTVYSGASTAIIAEYLTAIAQDAKNVFNPVVLHINSLEWDKQDRVETLFKAIHITDDDYFSRTLFTKWMWQCLAMAQNDNGRYGADGVLVLHGPQGIGKTRLAAKLALRPEWFKDGINLDPSNKDSIIGATRQWICELGELESTTRQKDIGALKAFITKSAEDVREPFGRKEVHYPRRTSYIGTVNRTDFLRDSTGNRRFWTITIPERFDWPTIECIDFSQLWAQVRDEFYALGDMQAFRLTYQEQQQLAGVNTAYQRQDRYEQEFLDIVGDSNNTDWQYMTATKFKETWPSLRNAGSEQIGRLIKKHGYGDDEKKGRKYRLPKGLG